MKKSLLALAVAALATASVASTASATTVYDKDGTSLGFHGRVQSIFYSDKASGVSNEEASINTSARFGVDLRSQITPGIAGFAMAEWEASSGNNVPDSGEGSDNFYSRLMWVGLDFGQFGSVKFGKFEESIKYAITQTDIFDDWGCTGLNGNDDRREGVVQYQWSGYGVTALLSYAFAKDNEHLDGAYYSHSNTTGAETVDLDYSVSAALGYTSPDIVFGPIDVRAGFAYGKFADGLKNDKNSWGTVGPNGSISAYDKYSQFALGLSWGKLNIGPYVALAYQQRTFDFDWADYDANSALVAHGSDDYKVKGYEFAVGYSFANGITARTGYTVQELETPEGDVKGGAIPVYVNWNLNTNFQVWAEARFDAETDDDNLNKVNAKNFAAATNGVYNTAENVFSAGVRYNF